MPACDCILVASLRRAKKAKHPCVRDFCVAGSSADEYYLKNFSGCEGFSSESPR